MKIKICKNNRELGKESAEKAADIIKKSINKKGFAVFIASSGVSQIEFLEELALLKDIDWSKTVMFHDAEYIGISQSHIASLRRFLRERFINKVNPGKVYLIETDRRNPDEECKRLSEIISKYEVDLYFTGIGEGGHISFNSPPADFNTFRPFLTVEIDVTSKKQAVNEEWFETVDDVPCRAITMSVQQIMKSENIICLVPEKRKAPVVKKVIEEPITPGCPASILRKHSSIYFFLSKESSSLLKK